MERILKILKENGIFFVATTDGQAGRVRPFGFVMLHEGKFYFVTANNKEVHQQLKDYPQCEICSCNAQGQWLRLRGTAVLDDRTEVKAKILEEMPDLNKIYKGGVDNPIMTAFYLQDISAVLMDMRGSFEKIAL